MKHLFKIYHISTIFLLLLTGWRSDIIHAQEYAFEIQTIPLSGEFINFSGTSFAQDLEGFMWFGASDGLYRYQGSNVKVFRSQPFDKHSLSDNCVNDLLVDSEGVLWIGTDEGLNRYDKYTESFTCYLHDPADSSSILWGKIWEIAEDKDSTVWIATHGGFCCFDRATETFRNYQVKNEDPTFPGTSQPVFSLYPDKEDHLYLFAGEGVYRLHTPSGKIERMPEISLQDEDSFTWDMFIDRSGRCWINTYYGLYLYDLQQKSIQQFILRQKNSERNGNQYNRSILEDSGGNIWVRTMDAIYCYSQELELKYYREHAYPYPDNYQSQDLTKEIFEDNTGCIWFYTPDGINQLINKKESFSVYSFDSTSSDYVNCIYPENKNLIWFGTGYGISSLDRSNNAVQMQYGSPWWESGPTYTASTMCLDRENTLWIGMESKGLISMEITGEGQRLFRKHIPESIDSTRLDKHGLSLIRKIFEDMQGRLWIGSDIQDCIQYYDRAENRMIQLTDNPTSKDTLPIHAIIWHQTGSDTLWAIGSSGLYKIEQPLTSIAEDQVIPAEVIQCQLLDHKGESFELPPFSVSYMDADGNIWLGSRQSGLIKMIPKRTEGAEANVYTVKSYSLSQGLPSYIVHSILPDEKGNLWIGTENGLSKMNTRSETFTNYFIRHGLLVNEFRPNSAAVDEDGEMFFGTIAGMVSFFPDSIFINQHTAPVWITEIRINNQLLQPGINNILTNAISFTDKIELPYKKNNLSIGFSILNYYLPELNQYKYILEGYNDDWVYAGNRTNIDFTNLDPGLYTFRVTGSNNDGIWNEEGRSLEIVIHPPPWRTWYAYLVYALLIAGVILWYRRYLLSRAKLRMAVELEKLEKQKVLELDQLKSRYFTNISHEFRTPLTLIHGPLADLDKQKTETVSMEREVLDMMKRNTERLQKLITQLLDISKIETGTVKLQVSEGRLDDFLRAIILSFLSLAESKKIKYTYQLPKSDLPLWFDADKLEKILVNLISNAFKFTPENGEISISGEFINIDGTEDPKHLSLEVTDTGIGISSERIDKIFNRYFQVNDPSGTGADGTGIGLALTKELVHLYHGDIRVKSIAGEGTTFILKLPAGMDLFREDERVYSAGESKEPVGGDHYLASETKPGLPVEEDGAKDKPQVLIVEDNSDLSKYIADNLYGLYRILGAGNGKQGYELAVEHIPDLVISDLMMPVMDGMEMCDLIKKDERTSHIPVIMLTARADRDSKLKGLQSGADDYIIKPFDAEELRIRAKNLVDQRRHLRKKFQNIFAGEEDNIELPYEDLLLKKLMEVVRKELSNPEFTVDHLANELNISRTQVFRKVHALTGYAPKELIRNMRLRRAAVYFRNGHKNVAVVMHEVGFNHQSNFSRAFRELYGMNPSEYMNKIS